MSEPDKYPVLGPLKVVRFENGLEVWLDEDGWLHVGTYERGCRYIAVMPDAMNACRIEVIKRMSKKRKQKEV